jgi:hypothetical protein
LLDRVDDRNISAAQLGLLANWMRADPEVPEGKWFKKFPGMTVCGEGELIIGSSLNDVLKQVGRPSKTVTGETLAWISDPASPNTSVPGVLYEDLNGMKGFGYYHQPAQHVQFFLKDDEVIALLIDVPKR